MADSNVPITAGTGTNIDTRTAPDGDHRQVMVIGDGTAATTATVNTNGSLMVQGPQSTSTSLSVTTATSSTGTLSCVGYNIATVTITGTHAGINLTFEISLDAGTTWVPINGAQLDAAVVTTSGQTGVITTNAARGWDIAIGAADAFRVRATAWTSGTGAVRVGFQTLPYEPAPVAQISGTVVSNVTTLGGSAITIGSGGLGAGTQRVVLTNDGLSTTTIFPNSSVNRTNVNSAATTNGQNLSAANTNLTSIACSNIGAAVAFVKLYQKTSAPTVGTDVPVLTIPVPAGSVVSLNLGISGHRFAGLSLAITNLAADTDTTAVAANQVKVILDYF